MEVRLRCPQAMEGEVTPPGDKSISHRAAILNALAQGRAEARNFSPGADCLATVSCLRSLGAGIRLEGEKAEIEGVGLKGLREAEDVLDCGNSGTTLRLLTGLLAPQPFLSILTGDASLRSRPMGRVIQPLRLMGAEIWGRAGDTRAPLVIRGHPLRGIEYRLSVPSAQVKSALLLAGLFAQGGMSVEEPIPTRDHTERMLRAMGAELKKENGRLFLSPLSAPLKPLDLTIPGDLSSAAYFLVAGAIHPQARVRIKNCGINPTRSGLLDVLKAMGARLKILDERWQGGEPVADLEVESSQLRAVELGGEIIPRLIDELLVLAVAALAARGVTVIRGAEELRVKEVDRIAAAVKEFSRLGGKVEELPDGMVIHGGRLNGGQVSSHGDHRLAMALAVASLLARGEIAITGAEAVDISYPNFWQEWENLTKSEI